ncbi:Pr6Pr family membrane protein [Celeribacter sp.]|uniref:Pr6Pr family membrane protein n=1 Tax=Celeribacter sp. TaxID=1890673 RepID=UPI003A8D8E0E
MMTRFAYFTAFALFVIEAIAYGASTLKHILEGDKSVPFGILSHQFKFFTLWTNVLVMGLFARIAWTRRLPHDGWLAATTLWLLIVMTVWHVLLGNDTPPTGLDWISDTLFHSVAPVALALWWVAFAPKVRLGWHHAALWLLWPLIYLVYAVTRGLFTGFYPYFFIDLEALGWGGLLGWAGKFLIAFYLAGLLIVAMGKLINRLNRSRREVSAPDGPQPR